VIHPQITQMNANKNRRRISAACHLHVELCVADKRRAGARADFELRSNTGGSPMSANHKEILQKANAAIMKGDYEGFLAFCTEDTEWTFVGDRTISGKEAVRQWMAAEYKEPPKFEVHHLVAENDFVAALGEITLKDEAGKDTRYAYCDVWRFRDGKMAGLQAFVVETAPDTEEPPRDGG
jgi:ketosteroid isomerase-like protein